MGLRGRQTFANQNPARSGLGSISPADRALLASVRPSSERSLGSPTWLRTCYRDVDGNSTDAAHEALRKPSEEFSGPNPYGKTRIFDDATLYDFGCQEWQHIFTRIPEILDASRFDADYYDQRKAEALQEAIENDEQEDAELEEQGYTKSEDGLHWSEIFQPVHYASQVGHIWVADEKAIRSGKLMVAWFDDCGRVVRYNRVPGKEVDEVIGLIEGAMVNEHGVWVDAEIGPDYDCGGICGPPSRSSAA